MLFAIPPVPEPLDPYPRLWPPAPSAAGPLVWIVNVNPSAVALVSWNVKSVMNDRTSTGVSKKALPVSFAPPSVSRRRLPLIAALPLSVRPDDVNPFAKLKPETGEFTVSVAVLLVTEPTTLLTITSNVDPLSALVVDAVVKLDWFAPAMFEPFTCH